MMFLSPRTTYLGLEQCILAVGRSKTTRHEHELAEFYIRPGHSSGKRGLPYEPRLEL